MTNTGKHLEGLVREIEKYLLPECFEVTSNERIYNDEGIQIAEFDIHVVGKVGSTTFNWLIECRDRPTQGPAPGSWIEQLVGRRDRFNFDKVTAVSTTGFAKVAIDFAKEKGIELRSVDEISVENIRDWFLPTYLGIYKQHGNLQHAELRISVENHNKYAESLKKVLANSGSNAKILKSIKDGKKYSLVNAFQGIINHNQQIFKGLKPNSESKKITIRAQYTNPNDRFQIEVDNELIDINEVIYFAELSIIETKVQISRIKQYTDTIESKLISESVGFDFQIEGLKLNLDFHYVKDSSKTFATLKSESVNEKITKQ
jgi:hypothetical protein